MFSTVPRVLEKVYDKVSLGVAEASGLKHKIGTWALALVKQWDLAKMDGGVSGWQHALADKLVYSKLREKLGHNSVLTQIPIGLEEGHEGVVDLVSMKGVSCASLG